jgi:DNA-binding NarL/FixJ family response regulator
MSGTLSAEMSCGRYHQPEARERIIGCAGLYGICLTDEERTVVRLIAEGHSNREVAKFFGVAGKTVENRRTTIMRKLKLRSGAALVFYAIRTGLIEP